jgi:Spy/CpxP family protein refolding chaperone
MKAITDEAMAKRKALIESVSSQITPILTPDQQTKFAALVQKFESGRGLAMRRHFGNRGGSEAGSPSASADASTSAGQSGPGGHGPDATIQHLTQALDLTSDQQAQIKPILEAAHTQMQSIRQDSSLTQEQKLAKVRETMEGAHSQINGLLTPEQQQKLGAMKAKFHHHGAPEAQPSASPNATPTPAPSA